MARFDSLIKDRIHFFVPRAMAACLLPKKIHRWCHEHSVSPRLVSSLIINKIAAVLSSKGFGTWWSSLYLHQNFASGAFKDKNARTGRAVRVRLVWTGLSKQASDYTTHFCRNFKLLDDSEFEEHANAGFDEVELRHGEVAEGEQVQILAIDIVCHRDVWPLNRNTRHTWVIPWNAYSVFLVDQLYFGSN